MYSSLVGLGFLVGLVVAGFLFRVGMFIADDLRSRYERARFSRWCESLSDEEFDALCAEDYEPQYCADEEEFPPMFLDEDSPYRDEEEFDPGPFDGEDEEEGINTVPLEEVKETFDGSAAAGDKETEAGRGGLEVSGL